MKLIDLLFSFRGRIGRTTFWILLFGISVVMTLAAVVVAFAVDSMVRLGLLGPVSPHIVAFVAVGIPCLWPLIAVQVKRWHDLNCSGWWFFINLIPMVGNIVSLVMCGFVAGTGGTNKYGQVPEGPFRIGA